MTASARWRGGWRVLTRLFPHRSIVAGAADRNSKGAVLGGLQTLQELASAAGYPLYGRLLAKGLEGESDVPVGAPYFAAAAFLALGALQARRL